MHGFLIINKPKGMTSAHIVAKVKRLLGRDNKIGHAGTLDPMATGVLPIAVNEATKVIQYLIDSDKEYEFEVTWGEERDTDDAEGVVVARGQRSEVSEEEVREAIKDFIGEIEQMPPNYSALKVDGKRAYDLAREGKETGLKARKVTIHNLTLTPNSHTLTTTAFRMECSKGTYVRSIARDMGRKLGVLGYVSVLHRSAHGKFGINDAITLEKLEELCQKGAVSEALLPLEEVLDGIPALPLDESELAKIRNGVGLDKVTEHSLVALKKDGKLVAMAQPKNGRLHPTRVFNH